MSNSMSGKIHFHESFERRETVRRPSDRSFGIVIAMALAIIAGIRLWLGHAWFWWIVSSIILLVILVLKPSLLSPLNRIWFKFGLLLHRIFNPVILGLIFYGVIFPIGMFMRIFGKRPLNLEYNPNKSSYWIKRNPPGPPPESMINQF